MLRFFQGPCYKRWRKILRLPVSRRQARILDIIVLSPGLVITGAFGKKIPRLLRFGLVAVGTALLLENTFDEIYDRSYEETEVIRPDEELAR